jgi:hypothetical protein
MVASAVPWSGAMMVIESAGLVHVSQKHRH